jgi:hypothetical protein
MPAGQQVALEGLVCPHCETVINENTEAGWVDYVCVACADNFYCTCAWCDRVGMQNNTPNRPRLLPSVTSQVRNYFTRMSRHYYVEDADEMRCGDCIHVCPHCESIYGYEDNASTCCEDEHNFMHQYSYRPSMKFWLNGDVWHWRAQPNVLYMGMEIEAEYVQPLLERFHRVAQEDFAAESFVYVKSDGSLYENGAEFVTMPATLEAIRNRMPFDAFKWLRDNGARAWAMTTCGMHVHVSRTAFTPTHLWKFLKFQYINRDKCIQFAGRNSEQWANWDNDTMQEQCANSTAKVVKQGRATMTNRYSAINMNPSSTIELRYFRPNLLKPGILRVAEFIDAMYEYTKRMTVRDIVMNNALRDWNSFRHWMSEHSKYTNAVHYMNTGVV